MKVKNKYIHTPFGLSLYHLNTERDIYPSFHVFGQKSTPQASYRDKPKQYGLVLVLTLFLHRPEIHHMTCE